MTGGGHRIRQTELLRDTMDRPRGRTRTVARATYAAVLTQADSYELGLLKSDDPGT